MEPHHLPLYLKDYQREAERVLKIKLTSASLHLLISIRKIIKMIFLSIFFIFLSSLSFYNCLKILIDSAIDPSHSEFSYSLFSAYFIILILSVGGFFWANREKKWLKTFWILKHLDEISKIN